MSKSRLKTISDQVLADAILEMRDDYGYWDQDPSVFVYTRDAFNKLGVKMSRGVREVVNRVEKDGAAAHKPLARIFKAASTLNKEERKSAWYVYEALRNLPRKKQPKPGYPF
jgi:hypothetical protein